MKQSKEKRQRIKVLPLPLWAESESRLEKKGLEPVCLEIYRENEIKPVFKRDGLYCSPSGAWLELDGRAYKYDQKRFLYELSLLSIKPLRACEFAAYLELFKAKLLSKTARKRFLFYLDWLKMLEIDKQSGIHAMQMKKRLDEIKKLKGYV